MNSPKRTRRTASHSSLDSAASSGSGRRPGAMNSPVRQRSALHNAILVGDWATARQRLRTHPHETSIVTDTGGLTPLDYAVTMDAPAAFIRDLIHSDPEQCWTYSDDGELTIHHGCRTHVRLGSLAALLDGCPECATAPTATRGALEGEGVTMGRAQVLQHRQRQTSPPAPMSHRQQHSNLAHDAAAAERGAHSRLLSHASLESTSESSLASTLSSFPQVVQSASADSGEVGHQTRTSQPARCDHNSASGPNWHNANADDNSHTPFDCTWDSRGVGVSHGRRQLLDAIARVSSIPVDASAPILTEAHQPINSSATTNANIPFWAPSAHITQRNSTIADALHDSTDPTTAPLRDIWNRLCLILQAAYSAHAMAQSLNEPPLPPSTAGALHPRFRVVHAVLAVECASLEMIMFAIQAYPGELAARDWQGDMPVHIASRGVIHPRRRGWEICKSRRGELILPIVVHSWEDGASHVDAEGRLPLHLALEVGNRFHREIETSDEGAAKHDQGDTVHDAENNVLEESASDDDGDNAAHSQIENMNPDPQSDVATTVYDTGIMCLLNAYPDSIDVRDPKTGLFPFMLAAVSSTWGVGGKKSSEDDTADLNTVYELLLTNPDLVNPGRHAVIKMK